ncbi:hypothetical protein FHS77_000854 [Paenochrobactrum gallinarii]|uniref:DUF1491 family protein n=1 Tax=Paenochrobactrum gallinarii TaxID=643673 RepID=A0A841LTV1_9HYPH|nr:DUF1491 family protein [Paenochrobactrum gallinarii]MBB6260330.1 hypothetical protein [Paenochrobactrum gallinarii]
MRLTSEFWVAALIRRIRGDNGFAYLAERGSGEAGAIFIKKRLASQNFHEETWELYTPAPQSAYDERKPDERSFILSLSNADSEACEKRLNAEKKFDSDLWILEIEDIADLAPYISIVPDPYA